MLPEPAAKFTLRRMPEKGFVHLHLHTEYSLLDGAIRVNDAAQTAARMGMPAIAMTDHGNLYGVVPFYQAAEKAGVKPIVGCEIYVAPGDMRAREAASPREAAYHLTLLAETDAGYRNLMKISSAAFLDGFYYKPRVDHDFLANHSSGLICLSGCLKGEINSALLGGQPAKAQEIAGVYRDIFGPENFFLELHDHGMEAQAACNRGLKALARDLGLRLVAANDVHFLERAHHESHDVMVCIGTGAMVDDEKRLHYAPELYMKSPQEMRELFRENPAACDNTLRIAERCNVKLELGVQRYPDYKSPEGKTREAFLRELCFEGLRRRYGERADSDPGLVERLDYELSVIERTGFVSYFLIVWDFIAFARSKGIPVGPGRGSAAGSLIAYVLGITDLDPLRFGLIFERFLNPDRISPPDIDIDFCQERRGEVIDYVRQKYGERAVAQIVTFNTLGAKSVIRDVGRVMGMSYADADRIARMIPNELGITLAGRDKGGEHIPGAIDKNPELKAAVENEHATAQLWKHAVTLEGLPRNTGIHAAGVVISDGDLSDHVPLARGNDGEILTQFEMGPLTDLGLLKMDFLGLKTLTVLHDAEQIVRTAHPGFRIEDIPLDDARTFEMLNRGETIGVFQLESGGMVNLCRRFDIRTIDDIIAAIALYRPGPMQLIDDYIERKRGRTPIRYLHPLLEQVCADTFGVMIYQEQVQRAANLLAGYTLAQADLLRRAMGKKDREKMAQERERFIEGCARLNAIPEKKAAEIFNLLENFAGYGFNKSHSAAYGLVSYRTAYFKANYPVAFMAATLSNEINNTDKIAVLVAECARMKIPILPPDMNRSSLKFRPEDTGAGSPAIRYGLSAIKNVGVAAMQLALEERAAGGPFLALEEFTRRVDVRSVNRKTLESLIKAGAFDFTKEERPVLFARLDGAVAAAASNQRDLAAGQVSLFEVTDTLGGPPDTAALDPPRWSPSDILAFEKELLGFYVTGHPLDEYREALASTQCEPIAMLQTPADDMPHAGPAANGHTRIGGALVSVEKRFTRRDNKPFAITVLEDLTGSIEVMFWGKAYSKAAPLLETGRLLLIEGRTDPRSEQVRFIAEEVKPLRNDKPASAATGAAARPLVLHLDLETEFEAELTRVREILQRHPGELPVELRLHRQGRVVARLEAGERYRVHRRSALDRDLDPWLHA